MANASICVRPTVSLSLSVCVGFDCMGLRNGSLIGAAVKG